MCVCVCVRQGDKPQPKGFPREWGTPELLACGAGHHFLSLLLCCCQPSVRIRQWPELAQAALEEFLERVCNANRMPAFAVPFVGTTFAL